MANVFAKNETFSTSFVYISDEGERLRLKRMNQGWKLSDRNNEIINKIKKKE